MSKKACKKKGFVNKEEAKYECKKCGARVNKKKKACKAILRTSIDLNRDSLDVA
jgi:uncharacterized membrane protein YvbJ